MLGRDGVRDSIGLVCPKRMEKTKFAWRVEVGVPGLGGRGLRSTGRQFNTLGGGEVV